MEGVWTGPTLSFHMSPKEAIRRLERLDQMLESAVVDAIEHTGDKMIALNQQQLYAGRLKDGSPVTPSYLDDPYFKSRESAQRYSDWKDEITPNDERPAGVPNLFINGRFYESWTLSATAEKITFQSSDPDAADIEEKFGADIYGLDDENMSEYRRNIFFPVLKGEIEAQTSLTFG